MTVATLALVTLAGSAGTASAAGPGQIGSAQPGMRPHPPSTKGTDVGARPVIEEKYTCVTANNVRFRTGPGLRYKALGQVNRGQGVEIISGAFDPTDGSYWDQVDLWGGPSGVWISMDFIGSCVR